MVGIFRRRLVAPDAVADDRYKSALVVTLLKLGEESFVRENAQSMMRLHDWLAAVLEIGGTTETGPNNCAAYDWPSTDYGPVMQPALERTGNKWRPRGQGRS